MPLTTAQIVRSRLNDPFRYQAETLIGDGTASAFKLLQGSPYSQISGGSFTASVPVAAGWSATGSTLDVTAGVVVFPTAISALSAIFCNYSWSTFSEDELAYFTAQGGIPQAVLMGVNHLLVDAAKRSRWGAPDGSTVDQTTIFNALFSMRSALIDETQGALLGPLGDSVSWSETQQDYN